MNTLEEFFKKMKKLLGEKEFEDFLKSYDSSGYYGLRINTLKISVEDFLKISPFELKPIPWTKDGFYYSEEERPGKHPFYHAGLYYIQEPSAMFPGAVIDAKPGEYILDLCAAPGGKTVQMAAGMKGKGLLVVNDINYERTKTLIKNIELFGVTNSIVTNEKPENLSSKFPGFFDKILVDAPCSGEGMIRKDEKAVKSIEKFNSKICADMQRNILEDAYKMLKPGGSLVYSTCTFSPEENEMMISLFLDRFSDCKLVEIFKEEGIEGGRPEWANKNNQLSKTARLWPHKLKGEGHFAALIKKSDDKKSINEGKTTHIKKEDLEPFFKFTNENLNEQIEGFFTIKKNHLYLLPVKSPDLSGLKIAKFGWYLGEFKRGRFEPNHSFIMPLKKESIKNTINFNWDSLEASKYLKGETLIVEGKKGYTGVLVDGHTLGWAKQTGSMLKNLYPKGWRKMT
ncbi:RsmB/NOP family class I SAM-dependent RNA methyltransferase [Herbivorax sp. ANBcel31]|uniref:RsmF rRNA methyltransferase first C-terminal domain-containing protein n=1 Tax=Herbivorax sp. ANBcel31 TaxID=3069754 RepID=UPI0027B36F19|nr:RsmB/NOP family class I SAM-dependent RNA methyltransferase [Herbivorax sp. ANBcel31]MDQ2085518.1 RsmB/NOP family class I SAM-dependent RNA methyltransferase [Herbivorax sp. ANBcel31]